MEPTNLWVFAAVVAAAFVVLAVAWVVVIRREREHNARRAAMRHALARMDALHFDMRDARWDTAPREAREGASVTREW